MSTHKEGAHSEKVMNFEMVVTYFLGKSEAEVFGWRDLDRPPTTTARLHDVTAFCTRALISEHHAFMHRLSLHAPVELDDTCLLHVAQELFYVDVARLTFTPAKDTRQVVAGAQRQHTHFRRWLKHM